MTPLETELLLARAVLLVLLYSFVGAVGLVAWLDLRASRQAVAADALGRLRCRLILLAAGSTDRAPGSALRLAPVTAIGRDLDCDIVLADPTVSGRHAVISRREGAWWLEDLHSTNGSALNEEVLPTGGQSVLRSGDTVQLGAVRLRFVDPDD